MPGRRSNSLPAPALLIIGLLVGIVLGYAIHHFFRRPPPPRSSTSSSGTTASSGAVTRTAELQRLVRTLATIEKLQNKGVDEEQAKRLLSILTPIESADKLSEKDCEEKLTAINTVLKTKQKQVIQDLQS